MKIALFVLCKHTNDDCVFRVVMQRKINCVLICLFPNFSLLAMMMQRNF
jgi:hypothetical protein